MTLEEEIKHCEEVAENQESDAELFKRVKAIDGKISECYERASEYRQLAEWLRELKAYREADETTKPCDYCQEFDCYGCVYKEVQNDT